jgi:hypothetical protein
MKIATALLVLFNAPSLQASNLRSEVKLDGPKLDTWSRTHFPTYVKMLTGKTDPGKLDGYERCGGIEIEQNNKAPDAGAPGLIVMGDKIGFGVSVNTKFTTDLPEICQLFGIGHEWGHLMHQELVSSIPELEGPALTPGKDEILADIMATRTLHKLGGFAFADIKAAIPDCNIFGTTWDAHGHPPGDQRRENVLSYCNKREAVGKGGGPNDCPPGTAPKAAKLLGCTLNCPTDTAPKAAKLLGCTLHQSWKTTLVQVIAEASATFKEKDLEGFIRATKGEGSMAAGALAFVRTKCTGPRGCEEHQTEEACSAHDTMGSKMCTWMTVCKNNPKICSGKGEEQ